MKFFIVILLCAWNEIISASLDCSTMESSDPNEKLRKHLLCNFNRNEAPAILPVVVTFDYGLLSFDFSETDQKLTVESFITMSWFDERLSWRPEDFPDSPNGTFAAIDEIWIPDVNFYNSDTMEGLDSCIAAKCVLTYYGNVTCANPCEHTAYCIESDFTYWPFDEHLCNFEYVSRARDISKIVFEKRSMSVDAENGWRNNRWKLLSANIESGNRQIAFYDSNKSHSFVVVNFIVERHSDEYLHQIMFPGVIFIAFNVIPMLLSPELPDRIILYIISLFSHFLYLEQLWWMLPHNGDSTPNVLTFFIKSQLFTLFLIIQTVCLKMFLMKKENPSDWIQMLHGKTSKNFIGQIVTFTVVNDESGPNVRQYLRLVLDFLSIICFTAAYVTIYSNLLPYGLGYLSFS